MSRTRKPADQVARIRSEHEVWIEHAKLIETDEVWLRDIRWLTLWNVTAPPGFLASLQRLEGLDLRGGSASDLSIVQGCEDLRCLVVNQIRGLNDLSILGSMTNLEYLQLYGLKQVVHAPSLAGHTSLRRLEVGLMRSLPELDGLLDAPELEELQLHKQVSVSAADVDRIRSHPTLTAFQWIPEDVPSEQWVPVVDAIDLPAPRSCRAEDWYQETGGLL